MLASHVAHHVHAKHVVIAGNVGFFVHRGDFELTGGHFVVAGLGRNAQRTQLVFQILHEAHHAGRNGAKVVVFHFLTLGRGGTDKGAASQQQVGTQGSQIFVNQEVFLFGAHIGTHVGRRGVAKELENTRGLTRQGRYGANERNLAVKSFARIRVKVRRNVQGRPIGRGDDEHRHGGIPRGIAACFKRGADAARRERGGVRLTADQHFAREFADNLTIDGGRQEGIVLFGSEACHGMEPVGVVRGTVLNGPILHGVGNNVGDFRIQTFAVAYGLGQLLEHVLGQALAHGRDAKHITAKDVFCATTYFICTAGGNRSSIHCLEDCLFTGGTHTLVSFLVLLLNTGLYRTTEPRRLAHQCGCGWRPEHH